MIFDCISFQSCSNFEMGVCPGMCSTLSTCESCTIWGQEPAEVEYAPAWSRKNELCGWCVQDQRCYPVNGKSLLNKKENKINS